ncbi:MAG: efflux transporter outer membrane subunit [Desulfovibrionaceae bacterium]|nr:efflux transporter outer membrane subunit [Desulfovibrionaceae bacterium]MBF0513458.1 efflux transporter outer membrane subunit [Desulfovibrionaceae bacterium]
MSADRLPILPILPALFAALIMLAPCACMRLGPDFTTPGVSLPAGWTEADVAATRPDSPPPAQWWTLFDDPALTALVAKAVEGNIPLKTAGLRVLEARAQLGIAVGNLYPQSQQAQGAYTAYQASKEAPASPQPGQQAGVQWAYWQNSFGLSAAWELDFWGKFRRSVESAQASMAASVADYDDALVILAADTAQTYVAVRTIEERLRIARHNLELQLEGLRIAQARFRLGQTSERDVAQAKTLLESTSATIPALTDQLAQAKHALAILLGQAPGDLSAYLGADSAIPDAPAAIAVGVPADLLRRRPDMRKAEMTAWAQCARIGVAKADLFPSFTLSGGIGFLASDMGAFRLGDIFLPRTFTAQAGPGFVWNVLNYGRLQNAVRVEDARFQQSLENYAQAALTAVGQAEDALSGFLRGREKAAFLAKAAVAAGRSAQLAFIQYREGQTDFTTVLVAEQNQLSQEDGLAQAKGDVATSFVKLYRALGGGWEIREGKPFVPADIRETMAKRTWWGGELSEDPKKLENKKPGGPGIGLPDY